MERCVPPSEGLIVYLCTNGMVMVFDGHGFQVTELQGRQKAILGTILAREGAENYDYRWMNYGDWEQKTSFEQVKCFVETWARD